jgi:CxxC motif-containing protein (DUF1111 family)
MTALRGAWLFLGIAACVDETAGPQPEEGEALSGGGTTVFETGDRAFSLSARNLSDEGRSAFSVGNAFFNDPWVTAPSSTEGRDGLGPTFNAKSCSACHFHDGRGRPPEAGHDMVSMLVRLSVPGVDAVGGPAPDPAYGGQIQPQGIEGVPGEASPTLTWEDVPGVYADGSPYTLRRPVLDLGEGAYGPFDQLIRASARVAPHMVGLGLLEAIPEDALVALADPLDANGDGISGRPNTVWDPVSAAPAFGRFGWKGGQAGLLQQNTGAFLGDMGITSTLHPAQDCPSTQEACAAAIEGGTPEVSDHIVDRVTFYTRTLAVPARRDVDDPDVLAGRELFRQIGCAACHVERFTTGDVDGHPELSRQDIRPFTDLLLHDLGPELSDERPDFDADGAEWRTPPLWGLGLVPDVNDHDLLLHDGRARGFAEAILWHGGEAEAGRDAFRALDAKKRDQLVMFLESL